MNGPERGGEETKMEAREFRIEAPASKTPDLDLSELSVLERDLSDVDLEVNLDGEMDAGVNGTEPASAELIALEAELRRVLRPVDLPLGFVDRVVARAPAPQAQPSQRAKVLPFRSWRFAAGGAIAASLLAGSLVFEEAHQRQARQHAAAAANQQFEAATRITDQTLQRTREQLRRAGVSAVE